MICFVLHFSLRLLNCLSNFSIAENFKKTSCKSNDWECTPNQTHKKLIKKKSFQKKESHTGKRALFVVSDTSTYNSSAARACIKMWRRTLTLAHVSNEWFERQAIGQHVSVRWIRRRTFGAKQQLHKFSRCGEKWRKSLRCSDISGQFNAPEVKVNALCFVDRICIRRRTRGATH